MFDPVPGDLWVLPFNSLGISTFFLIIGDRCLIFDAINVERNRVHASQMVTPTLIDVGSVMISINAKNMRLVCRPKKECR